MIEFYPGNEVRFLVTGADTDGTVEIFERLVPPGEMIADLHLHTDTTETFRVLQGEVEFTLGTEVRIVGAGGCVVAPPLTPHALRNSGDQPVILQIMFTPSRNHDRFFHLLQENWPGIGQRDQALTDRIRREFDGFTCDGEGNPTDGLPRDATY